MATTLHITTHHMKFSALVLALLATVCSVPAGAAMLDDQPVTAEFGGATETPAAKSWLFVDGAWGRIEIGRTDPAATGVDAARFARSLETPGAAGEGLRLFTLPGLAGEAEATDRTRVSYFTPRVMGLQAGASLTPDTATRDGNATLALGYRERLGDIGLNLNGAVATGDAATGAWGLSGRLDFGGFELGAGYKEFNFGQTVAGDADRRMDIGLGFSGTGWQLSAGFSLGWARGEAGDSPVGMFSLAGGYTPAAGWDLRADLNFIELRNGKRESPENRAGAVVVISSILTF
jgi:outer membrane protein OmpU